MASIETQTRLVSLEVDSHLHDVIIDKTQSYKRRIDALRLRIPPQVVSTLSLHLSLQEQEIFVDSEKLLYYAACISKHYAKYLKEVKTLLNVQPALSLSSLCIKFGCSHLLETLKLFREEVQSKKTLAFENNIIIASVFYLGCKLNGVKVDKHKLQFQFLDNSVEFKTCSSKIEKLGAQFFKEIVSNKRVVEEEEGVQTVKRKAPFKPLLGYTMIPLERFEDTEDYKNMIEFKSKMRNKLLGK